MNIALKTSRVYRKYRSYSMAEISYYTFVLSLGSKIQFLHNISSFLYTTSSGRGLRCSLSSISVLLLLQAKGIDEFRPEGARAAGRSR